jgi:hypothetical protein
VQWICALLVYQHAHSDGDADGVAGGEPDCEPDGVPHGHRAPVVHGHKFDDAIDVYALSDAISDGHERADAVLKQRRQQRIVPDMPDGLHHYEHRLRFLR